MALFKPDEFDNAGFSFSCGRKHFENEPFRKRCNHDGYVIFLPDFLKHKSEMTGDCYVFKFRSKVDGKHLMHHQSENFVFKHPPV